MLLLTITLSVSLPRVKLTAKKLTLASEFMEGFIATLCNFVIPSPFRKLTELPATYIRACADAESCLCDKLTSWPIGQKVTYPQHSPQLREQGVSHSIFLIRSFWLDHGW